MAGACEPTDDLGLASRRLPTPGQAVVLCGLVMLLAIGLIAAPGDVAMLLVIAFQLAFAGVAVWRCWLVLATLAPEGPPPPGPRRLPRYTVLVAVHDEAAVMNQLAVRLAAIDYPPRLLQGFLLIEADDPSTLEAARLAPRPAWLEILTVPPGTPRTKPRALNAGLARATGDLVTVFDAEDEPHPGQLREAAAGFAMADASLVCLQAPLRIRTRPGRRSMIGRQFAVEYASLFEVTLPGMTRLGLPFPLGGTSNHFRTDALRRIGGWDAWNVTEDADLGFRLWRAGGRLGVLTLPTWESPPDGLDDWLPQRTRWLKGFMQTWGVHTRNPLALGPRGLLALVMTLGVSLGAAAVHALSVGWVITAMLISIAAGVTPATPVLAIAIMVLGCAAAWLSAAIGAGRVGLPYRPTDMLESPAYWSLLSLAFVQAVWRLATEPFRWDKTPHRPDAPLDTGRTAALTLVSDHGADPVATARDPDDPALGRLRPAGQRRRAEA